MRTIIQNATIVNEERTFRGCVTLNDDRIADISENQTAPGHYDRTVDASGCFLMPGIIDCHVHFREPGLTAKADMDSESRSAAYGGVTSYFDMPNTVPQTTTVEALEEKFRLARKKSHVNYSFFFGATNDNIHLLNQLDAHQTPGIKLFMGSSTGNMLVNRAEALTQLFANSPLPIMAHCEHTATIDANMRKAKSLYGDDPDISLHPIIRSAEACYESTALAVRLAKAHGARLHVAHITTARELDLFGTDERITAEAVVSHLFFSHDDYSRLGALIKCNPSIKTPADREALRQALSDGRITTVGTDHAPHQLHEKVGGAARAMSGMPMIQFALPTMLELADQGVLSLERVVRLMCHNPARLFEVRERGFLRRGFKADLVVVRPHSPWIVGEDTIQSKCKWSPMTGHEYQWRVEQTFCNGHLIYDRGRFDDDYRGEAISFR